LLILASVHPQPHAHALSPPLAPFLAPSRCPLAEPAGRACLMSWAMLAVSAPQVHAASSVGADPPAARAATADATPPRPPSAPPPTPSTQLPVAVITPPSAIAVITPPSATSLSAATAVGRRHQLSPLVPAPLAPPPLLPPPAAAETKAETAAELPLPSQPSQPSPPTPPRSRFVNGLLGLVGEGAVVGVAASAFEGIDEDGGEDEDEGEGHVEGKLAKAGAAEEADAEVVEAAVAVEASLATDSALARSRRDSSESPSPAPGSGSRRDASETPPPYGPSPGSGGASRQHVVRLTTTELARTRCAEPAVTLAFVGTADSTRARLVSLSDKGAAHAWKQRLTHALPLPLPDGHVGTHLAIATRRRGGSLIALASTHATERAVARGIGVMVLANLAARARSADRAAVGTALGTALGGALPVDRSIVSDCRSLVIPVPILGLAFCGTHSLCVAHPDEYVLISIGSGCVRELFRFAADYGAPFLRRLSENTLLVLQPPPRAGERQLGLFVDPNGHVAKRSTIHWRQTPLDCAARGRATISVLPNAVEVHHPEAEPQQQWLPLEHAIGAADGGNLVLVASREAVYAMLPPVSVAVATPASASPRGTLSEGGSGRNGNLWERELQSEHSPTLSRRGIKISSLDQSPIVAPSPPPPPHQVVSSGEATHHRSCNK